MPEQKQDYKNLGLKVGIEVHQQLNTSKLFCNCPSLLRDDRADILVRRKQYAVAGETGKIDAAAAFEQAKGREFVYEAFSDSTCLVEIDEEPPHKVNPEAFFIALQISRLLNANILQVTQVMRKTVIDGSNTSGFQRTLLIARDGYVETSQGKVGIETIVLEEDAARIVRQDSHEVTFRLDRLGIPLVEIATKPEIHSSQQAKEVAAKLGEILRACNVKRGIGTIRQDLNISIKQGARVEIKGVQDLSLIPKIIEKEIERQLKEKNHRAEVRRAEKDSSTSFLRPLPGEARMYPETDLPLVSISNELLKEVNEKLPKLIEEDISELMKLGIHREIASEIIRENKLPIFHKLLGTKNPPLLVANAIAVLPKSIKAHYKVGTEKLTEEVYKQILEAFYKREIAKDAIEEVLAEICKGTSVKDALKKFRALSRIEVEKHVKEIIRKNPQLAENKKVLIGEAMKELRGKADWKVIAEVVQKV